MHPKALLEACSELVRLTLKFDHPADATVSRFFREHPVGKTLFSVLLQQGHHGLRKNRPEVELSSHSVDCRSRKLTSCINRPLVRMQARKCG